MRLKRGKGLTHIRMGSFGPGVDDSQETIKPATKRTTITSPHAMRVVPLVLEPVFILR